MPVGGAGSRGMGRAGTSESSEVAALPLACTERKVVRERWGGTWAVGLLELGCQWGHKLCEAKPSPCWAGTWFHILALGSAIVHPQIILANSSSHRLTSCVSQANWSVA